MSSALRGKGLKVEDPTAVARPVPQPVPQPVAESVSQEWREWTAATGATSYRLPPELLNELAGRSHAIGVPQGQIVTAAITAGLDLDDEQLLALVERAARALRAGQRKAKRRGRTPTQT